MKTRGLVEGSILIFLKNRIYRRISKNGNNDTFHVHLNIQQKFIEHESDKSQMLQVSINCVTKNSQPVLLLQAVGVRLSVTYSGRCMYFSAA